MPAPQAWEARTATAKAVVAAGFNYDPGQDIIYSRMNAWQRHFGYCWAYDVAAPGMSMIIDCEPICFTSGGVKWMIELWKGQYGLETGAEIGVYKHAHSNVVSTALERWSTWYPCASNDDIAPLKLSFKLKRNGQDLLSRGPESHWWLTGFKWGVFTDKTSDLTLDVTIKFDPPATKMGEMFADALRTLGYQPGTAGGIVSFTFHKPKALQPGTRSATEKSVQSNNKALIAKYNALKAALGLTNNDPNGFDLPNAKKAVLPLVQPLAQSVVGKVGKVVALGQHMIQDVGSPDSMQEIFALFHKRLWRTARR